LNLLKEIDEENVKYLINFTKFYIGGLGPIISLVGGFVAQEVIKVCISKFKPLCQWLVGDFLECFVPLNEAISGVNPTPLSEQNTSQSISYIGGQLQEKLSNLRVFLVGVGAIGKNIFYNQILFLILKNMKVAVCFKTGCEVLKNLVLLNVATGPRGMITITDMDRIEHSNLSRQCLFHQNDIGRPKSTVAKEKLKLINPLVQVTSFELEIGPETKHIFDQEFFSNIDVIITALDNKESRLVIDDICIEMEIPVLESGTEGTKGHTQVIIPHLTKCYRENSDPEPEEFQKCTLAYFPYRIEHNVQWARDWFDEMFYMQPKVAKDFITHKR